MTQYFIVGSSSKISLELQLMFKNRNAKIFFFGRSNPHKLKNFTKYDGIKSEESVQQLWAQIRNLINLESEEIHIVILSGVSSHDWRESFLVNEYMPAKLSEEFACFSQEYQKSTSIVLVGSSSAYQGGKITYSATKSSLNGIMHSIAMNYSPYVRINLVVPSAFKSGMISDWSPQKQTKVASSNLVGRLGYPQEIADAIIFAATNKFVTNSVINMTGGTVLMG